MNKLGHPYQGGLLLLLLSPAVLTIPRPDGAPEDVCETMDPSHGATPQTGTMPFYLMLDTHRINSDGCVYFTIRAKTPNTFSGFMVQARGEREGRPVGVFTEGEDVKLMECFGEPDNTATHLNSEPKAEVTMRWIPDNGYQGQVVFHATVAKTMKEYWVRQKAKPLMVSKSKSK